MTLRMAVGVGFAVIVGAAPAAEMRMNLRSRVEAYRGSGEWREVSFPERLAPAETALILCDVWDRHWCQGASDRVALLAPRISALVDRARGSGILIIHAPSDTMTFYRNDPARLRTLAIPKAATPAPLDLKDPPLPIDDSDGGCDTRDNKTPVNTAVWTRQHPAIHVAATDLVTDKGDDVYAALRQRGIRTLLIAGVHTNMCVLGRSFAIRQMTRWGVHCILIRDLTDAMYNPQRRPFVSHDQGTALVIEHIEKYWAPTVTSVELMRALGDK
jgi:nicotinamidase-related amidase